MTNNEDPVCGSTNATVSQWPTPTGTVTELGGHYLGRRNDDDFVQLLADDFGVVLLNAVVSGLPKVRAPK
ncbi:hypothetical protein [Arthrobacter mobilis]|uniref:Uncharacterized protein n=1 Tax=Arthrobacter mobilis TaxID=2724944 RepID=A0A7X6K760_9MICC|nr:hypothetical protein [Arthrobacter mobilis]NKX56396.1 hypothetical protein [Arthrobacter mobilis]